MATKKIKLHSSSLPEVAVQTTDWALCALCQQSTSEPLRDPSKAKNECQSRACETLANNLRSMDELDSLPLSRNISRLDDGTGIEATLTRHDAKWHKTCYVMCNKTKVDRVRKKVTKEQPQQQVIRHLKVGSGERFLPHLTRVLKKYQCVSFVMPQWSKINTKLLPRSLIL